MLWWPAFVSPFPQVAEWETELETGLGLCPKLSFPAIWKAHPIVRKVETDPDQLTRLNIERC
jgi:hypothetical protein